MQFSSNREIYTKSICSIVNIRPNHHRHLSMPEAKHNRTQSPIKAESEQDRLVPSTPFQSQKREQQIQLLSTHLPRTTQRQSSQSSVGEVIRSERSRAHKQWSLVNIPSQQQDAVSASKSNNQPCGLDFWFAFCAELLVVFPPLPSEDPIAGAHEAGNLS